VGRRTISSPIDRSDLTGGDPMLGGVDLQTSRLSVLAGGRRLELDGKRHDGWYLVVVLWGVGCKVRWFGMAQKCLLR
jgi:hypothetical protein